MFTRRFEERLLTQPENETAQMTVHPFKEFHCLRAIQQLSTETKFKVMGYLNSYSTISVPWAMLAVPRVNTYPHPFSTCRVSVKENESEERRLLHQLRAAGSIAGEGLWREIPTTEIRESSHQKSHEHDREVASAKSQAASRG